MLGSNINGNSEVFLVVDGKEKLIPQVPPVTPDQPLPRVTQVLVRQDDPPPQPHIPLPTPQPASPPSPPTLDTFLDRWRRGKAGLKPATEAKLDEYLKMVRRYVDTKRPVSDYKSQDIRNYLANARADKNEQGSRRLKGQTINEAIWRSLNDAFHLAMEERFIVSNPMVSVKREKAEPINRNQHKWEDAERLLEDVKSRAPESYLELKFMLMLGVGQAEARDIMGGSVKWNDSQITFVRKKTGKQYTVPVYPWATDFIRTEIEPRLKQNEPVFDWRNPRKALETSCLKLGLPNLEIRSLRRTLIIHLIQKGVELRMIAKWQGHRDAALILQRYGKFIDADHEKHEIDKLKASATQK